MKRNGSSLQRKWSVSRFLVRGARRSGTSAFASPEGASGGRRRSGGMNRGKLLIALVVAAVLTVGVGSSLIPSGAATGAVLVKLPTGSTISVPGCLPVGANVAGGVVIQGCDPAPAPTPTVQVAPPSDSTPTQSTPTQSTPTTGTTTGTTNTTPD